MSWLVLSVSAVLVICFSLPVPEFLSVGASMAIGNETDQLALIDFKSMITDDPLGVLGSWNGSIHFCQWHGVTCSRRHQRVTILDLQSLKLSGSISPYIGNLSFLKELHLENNYFSQGIPSEIDRLRRLEVLALNNNSIGGEIPTNISGCSSLIDIRLSFNQLAGKIPSEFGSLLKIEILSMSVNNLTGSIPLSLGNLSSIKMISFAENSLAGSIPDTFGWLKNIVKLELDVNKLSGTIPSSIFNNSSIQLFDVGDNKIHGDIPLDLGTTVPNLRIFSIESNQISSAIPPSISNASMLEEFQAQYNKLTGEVPNMEKLHRLYRFVVTSNNLGSGERGDLNFLCSLTNASLEVLDINGNSFGGLLPECIGNLPTTLEFLLIDNNKIFGSIPTGIGKLVSLQRLDMWKNQLSGTIPPAIGKLQNLRILYLDENQLSGNIPLSIGNLKLLIEISLMDNLLEGNIPSSLGECESLTGIDFSNNNLSGIIPPQLIGLSSLSLYINLSGNQLIGSLPIEVEKLKNLEILDVSGNMLEGEIPSGLASCIKLEILAMNNNSFRGPIPSSLRGLKVLDLANNNFSGEIPKFLAEFQLLEYLNLSRNNFEGNLPIEGVFKNASATSVMGNNKLCGGLPVFQLPTCSFKNNGRYRKFSRGMKIIISISVFVGLVLVSFIIFSCLKRRRELSKQPSGPMLIKALRQVSYETLFKATDGFSSTHLIGVGSFGSVYKGILDEDGVVAIKVLNLQRRGASNSFMAECKALRNVRHRNLVSVITSCSSIDFQGNAFKALVYEHMSNGSLEKWLHPDAVPRIDEEIEIQNLTLLQRISIAIDVASALDYLHHHCQEQILHCDLKPSNVLLDNDLIAHIGDFGLARFYQEVSNPNQSSSIAVRGTIGYAAPEYGLGSEVSANGDVYSYGILLLEMMTRKKPTNIMFEGDLNLHNFSRMALPDHVVDIVDPILLINDYEDLATTCNPRQQQARLNDIIECLISVIRIGVACSMESPQDRMNITTVVHELQSIKNIIVQPGTFVQQAVKR